MATVNQEPRSYTYEEYIEKFGSTLAEPPAEEKEGFGEELANETLGVFEASLSNRPST